MADGLEKGQAAPCRHSTQQLRSDGRPAGQHEKDVILACPAGQAALSHPRRPRRQPRRPTARPGRSVGHRPYDLRHAAVSLWLNFGVPATEATRRAGHGVAVLLEIYAHCIDGQADAANKRITDALSTQDTQPNPNPATREMTTASRHHEMPGQRHKAGRVVSVTAPTGPGSEAAGQAYAARRSRQADQPA